MVDIGATTPGTPMTRLDASPELTNAGIMVEVRPADDVTLADYEAFCRAGVLGPAQHPLWVRSWIMATGADAVIVTVHRDGRPAFALALEVVRQGPFRVARFMGGRHANGNFAAATRHAVPLSAAAGKALAAAVRQARPDIDLMLLERQNPRQEGLANPLSDLATMRSPNVSLSMDLSGGFEAALARMNGKRKRKKLRYQLRKLEDAGGYRLIEAGTPEEVERLIAAFYALKAAWFARRGIADVFAAPEVRAFFRQLFLDALDHRPLPFMLEGLEVAGEIWGVNGFSITPKSYVCEFCAIRDDDPQISPGFHLDYVAIERACEEGKDLYDFSVGDEPYKRSWCDVETRQFDTVLPLTAKGRARAAWAVARAGATRLAKSNGALWSSLKKLRGRLAGG